MRHGVLGMAALMRWHLSWGWKDKEPGVEGLGERPFQAEGAAGAGATEQTGAGMFVNRKSGLGRGGEGTEQGGVRSGRALEDRTASHDSCRSWHSSPIDLLTCPGFAHSGSAIRSYAG